MDIGQGQNQVMEKHFRPLQLHKETRGHKVNKPDLCDHQEKDHKHGKTVSPKSQHKKHHHQNQDQHHYQNQQESHQSNENDSHDTHSTVEDSSSHHHHHKRHHSQQSEKTDHCHPHHYHHKQKHHHVADKICHLPVSGTSSSSSSGSSSSSFSSSSSSTSSSSTSPSTSTSASSSTLSSDSSSESFDRHLLRKPQHSQSCTDISRRQRAFEEEDDTTPLIDDDGHLKFSAKKKQERAMPSHRRPAKGTLKNKQRITRKKSGKNGRFRKAKSMEALSRPEERDGQENEDEEELERRKNEARKNLVKEKLKFSAFLNEITRQVLSPLRLTSLGVIDAHKPCSPGQAPIISPKTDSRMGKHRQQRSQPGSADSISSSNCSHSSMHSQVSMHSHASGHSHSKLGMDHHHSHHDCTGDPPHHMHIRTSPTSSCSQRCHSHSPTYKHHHHHQGDHHGSKHHHHHGDRNSPSRHHHHHRDHHIPTPHHGNHHSTIYHHGDHQSPTHLHGDHHSTSHHHHHGDHHGAAHHHGDDHHEDHHNTTHHRGHHHSPHHHEDHHSPTHHHGQHNPTCDHGDHHNKTHHHHHVDHHSPAHQHHHGDHHSSTHQHHHGDHHSSTYQHHHGDHHSSTHQYHHGDHHSPTQQHHLGNHHGTTHRHHHGDHHSSTHRHHHRDHQSTSHHQGDGPEPLHNPSHSKNNDPECHNPAHSEAQHHSGHSDSLPHHQHVPHHYHQTSHSDSHHPSPLSDSEHNPTHSESHYGHHSSHQMSNHRHHPTHEEPHHHSLHAETHRSHHHDEHHSQSKGHSPISLSSDRKLESLSSSPSSQDEEQTSYTGSSFHKDKAQEMGRIMMLQEQNEDLHHSLLKTAVRMECLGEEFLSSHQLLEAELQRTRMELSNLLERFKRLQDNCSSTQQTNNLLEQKLHSVAHNMEGQRERLNQRISELTEQLANAKISTSMETLRKTSALHKTVHHHFQSDDSINRVVLSITPPPAQFMDSHNCGKTKATGQDQSLGSVPEEEESDWSEMGEETPRFILMGPNRCHAKTVAFSSWGHREGEGDIDSESGGEEIVRQHSPRSLQIPHLQFTVHSEILPVPLTDACHSSFKNLSDGMTGVGGYRFTTGQKFVSPILIRSASLEEIPLTHHHMQEELRGTEAMMDLHHPEDEAIEDSDNEIIHHWRTSNDSDTAMGRCLQSRTSEPDNSLASLQSAQRMLNHFICELPSSEGDGQVRVEVQGWTGGLPDEVLKGERTQL